MSDDRRILATTLGELGRPRLADDARCHHRHGAGRCTGAPEPGEDYCARHGHGRRELRAIARLAVTSDSDATIAAATGLDPAVVAALRAQAGLRARP